MLAMSDNSYIERHEIDLIPHWVFDIERNSMGMEESLVIVHWEQSGWIYPMECSDQHVALKWLILGTTVHRQRLAVDATLCW